MSILGVIVRAHPAAAEDAQAALSLLPGLDVAAAVGGRFVVVIEDSAESSAAETMVRVALLPQVLNTSLVYEHSEGAAVRA
jgi:nitrate reductase NapAB chaperone NapD